MMQKKVTPLDQLVRELDDLFSIHDWEEDPAMSRWVPRVYAAIGYDYTNILQADFCARFNGLMLRSSEIVREVYCAVFPCPEILDRLLETAEGDSFLFLHHPVDMEVSGVGFLPISPDDLRRLKTRRVSVYACHAPMDCHDQIGTNSSIGQAFAVQVQQHFAEYGHGYAGRIGSIAPTNTDDLIQRGREVFGVERVEVGGARPATITQVAIVAGGGDGRKLMQAAEQAGAQAYITGEWYTRTQPADEQDRKWAAMNRADCMAYAEASKMALLGFSHAATEFVVMKSQMVEVFAQKDLPVVCLEPSDWWR